MIFYESPFKLELIGRILHKDGNPLEFSTRPVSGMAEVLMDPKKTGPDGIAYYMYRDVYSSPPIRYDITVLPPRMFGEEFVKTYGHYHPKATDSLTYPEIYQILNGEGIFIMQTPHKDDSVDCITVKCTKGDIVFVPPNYGHVLVNSSPTSTLVSSNVVSNSFSSDYSEYKSSRGAAYYYTKDGFTQNLNCIIRKTENLAPRELLARHRLILGDLLEEITKRPEKLLFLEDPSLL